MLDLATIVYVNAVPGTISAYESKQALNEVTATVRNLRPEWERNHFNLLRRVALLERALNPSDLEAIRRQR